MWISLLYLITAAYLFYLARRRTLELQFRRCFATERDVRKRLEALALRFHEVCRLEIELQQRLLIGVDDSVSKVQNDLVDASLKVAEAKKDFWWAVKLAKRTGYIREKVDSYNRFLFPAALEKRIL